MIGIIVSITLLVIALIETLVERKIYNPLTLFSGMWSLICLLAHLQLFGMLDFADKGYFIILIGNIGFTIGYFFARFHKKGIENKNERYKKYIFREKLIYFLTILLLIFFAIIAVRVITTMNSSGISYSQMRTLYMRGTAEEQSTLIYGNMIFKTLELYVFKPMLFAMIAISTVRFFEKMKVDKQIVFTMLALVFYVAINFGRIIIVQTGMCILLCAFVMGKKISVEQKKKMKKIVKRYALPLIIVMIAAFFFISNERKSDYSNPSSSVEEIYAYLAIPVPIMNYWIEVIDSNGTMTYGTMYFKGVLNFITTFTNKIGIEIPTFNEATLVLNETETFLQIFPHKVYNAFTTIFYAFYVDFREVGVLLGSLIYGALLGKIFKTVISERKNLLTCSLYVLIMQGFIKCFVRWEFLQMSYCLAFLWIFLLIKKNNNKELI